MPTVPCPVCGAAFDRPAKLARHSLSHTGSRPCVCDTLVDGVPCGKAFQRNDHLERHVIAEHTLVRKFVCSAPGCGKSFYEPSHLQRHDKTHARAPREPKAAKPGGKRAQRAAEAGGVGAVTAAAVEGAGAGDAVEGAALTFGAVRVRPPRPRSKPRAAAVWADGAEAALVVAPQLSPGVVAGDVAGGGDGVDVGGDEGVGWAALGEAVAAVSAAGGGGGNVEEPSATAAAAAHTVPGTVGPPAAVLQPGLRQLAASAATRRRAAAPAPSTWDPSDPVEGPSAIVDRLSPAAMAAAHPGLRDALAYACPFAGCGARLPGRTLWRAHIKTSHRAPGGGGSFRCEACGRVERAVRGLERHWLACDGGGGGGGGGGAVGAGEGVDVAEAAAGGGGEYGAAGGDSRPLKRAQRGAPGGVGAAASAAATEAAVPAAAADDVPMSAFLSSALALGGNPFYAPPALLWLDDGEGDGDEASGGKAAGCGGAGAGGQRLPRSRAASVHSAPSPPVTAAAALEQHELLLALPTGVDAGTSAAALGTARRPVARAGKRGRGASMSSFDPLELTNV